MKFQKPFLNCCIGIIFLIIHTSIFASYVTTDNIPSAKLVELFRELGPILKDCKNIPKDKIRFILKPNTPISKIQIEDLYLLALEAFKRPVALERKNIDKFNDKFLPFDSPKVRNLIRDLGDIDTVYPKKQEARYLLIQGGSISTMRKRISFLCELVKKKQIIIKPNTEIVFLTGDRDLYAEEKSPEVQFYFIKYPKNPNWRIPNKLATTEYQAAKITWAQLDKPKNLKDIKVNFINASKKIIVDFKTEQKVLVRPTTINTLMTWLDTYNIAAGHCILISSQPFVQNKELTLKRILQQTKKKGVTAEVIGIKRNKDLLLAVYLDNIARSLYEITLTNRLKKLHQYN